MKRFVVIGLGRFGFSLAKALSEKDHEVLAIDRKEDIVQDIMEYVTKAVCLDATDEKAMKSVGVQESDVAVCGIGTNIEASILITLLLKELGLPVIVCKAVNEPHKKVLMKIGASKVILPEIDTGTRLANTLASIDDNILEHIQLPGNASIVEFIPPEEFIGKNLRDINIRAKYGLNVIAIKKQQKDPATGVIIGAKDINVTPLADDIIQKDDILVVFGETDMIDDLKNKG